VFGVLEVVSPERYVGVLLLSPTIVDVVWTNHYVIYDMRQGFDGFSLEM
jgi:hypothetical protein